MHTSRLELIFLTAPSLFSCIHDLNTHVLHFIVLVSLYLNLNVLPRANFQIWGVGVRARWSSSASSQPPMCHYQKFASSSRTYSFFYYFSNLSQSCWPMLFMVQYTYTIYMRYACMKIYIFKAVHTFSFANIHLNCHSKDI